MDNQNAPDLDSATSFRLISYLLTEGVLSYTMSYLSSFTRGTSDFSKEPMFLLMAWKVFTLLLRCHCFYSLSEDGSRKKIMWWLHTNTWNSNPIPYIFSPLPLLQYIFAFSFWLLLFTSKLKKKCQVQWAQGGEKNSWSSEEKGDVKCNLRVTQSQNIVILYNCLRAHLRCGGINIKWI